MRLYFVNKEPFRLKYKYAKKIKHEYQIIIEKQFCPDVFEYT